MSTFTKGDEITIDDTTWIVDNVVQPTGKRAGVRLVDSKDPQHHTAFFDDVLHNLIKSGRAVRNLEIAKIDGHFDSDHITFERSGPGEVSIVLDASDYDGVSTLGIPLNKNSLLHLAAVALDIARELP